MGGKFSFTIRNQDRRRDLPGKVIIGRQDTETVAHVALKFLGFVLLHRERLQAEVSLHNENIPFRPCLVQLDYELRPRFWVECGECPLSKLDKLAVKVPEAEIWVLRGSQPEAEDLLRAMAKANLRRNRYHAIGMDGDMFQEICALIRGRNEMVWVKGEFEPPEMQFDFNGLWFDTGFSVFHF
jgi:hypothetical protein